MRKRAEIEETIGALNEELSETSIDFAEGEIDVKDTQMFAQAAMVNFQRLQLEVLLNMRDLLRTL